MRATFLRYAKSQSGFTLVELLVASAIGLIVMTGLTSLVLTTWRAGTIATSRVAASGQIRSFQVEAYDDFALSRVPTLTNCGAGSPPPCKITLSGLQASKAGVPLITPYQVDYVWDGVNVDRNIAGGSSKHAATGVSEFSAYLAGPPGNQTVVVKLTITIQSYPPYSETQTLRFYPRVNP
jgi:prepilin-type N-terminal cleavage/methylation domain-containing protein